MMAKTASKQGVFTSLCQTTLIGSLQCRFNTFVTKRPQAGMKWCFCTWYLELGTWFLVLSSWHLVLCTCGFAYPSDLSQGYD